MTDNRYKTICDQLIKLRNAMLDQTIPKLSPYYQYFPDGVFTPSAINLAQYLILRQYDLRQLQPELQSIGLSSLGRGEENILENLNSVIDILKQVSKTHDSDDKSTNKTPFTKINDTLEENTVKLLGKSDSDRLVRIMVTLPRETVTDYNLVLNLINTGMNSARINCAHDNKDIWQQMIGQVKKAEKETGKCCRIVMDIAGQKIRTAEINDESPVYHVKPKKDKYGSVTSPEDILILPKTMFNMTPPPVISNLFKLSIDDEDFFALGDGDILKFKDLRGKKRKLIVSQTQNKNILIAQCAKNAYISPKTCFKHIDYKSAGKTHQKNINIVNFQVFPSKIKVHTNDKLLITSSKTPSRPAIINDNNEVIRPASISISHDDIINKLKVNDTVWIDDGKIGAIVEHIGEKEVLLNITHAPPKGAFIHSEKGLNFPNTELNLPPLTNKDLEDLDFIATHADVISYSFVQSHEDMDNIVQELQKRDAAHLPIIIKIETKKAVKNLPEIILSTIGRAQIGVMIARGDLAVELGSIRMAEIQEEILWICEAAHIPVVWATQVLESLAKNRIQSRPEITDAAMSVRAECVMLNKGPYIIEALKVLDNILKRMQEHQYKKTSRMRALKQWKESENQPPGIPFI